MIMIFAVVSVLAAAATASAAPAADAGNAPAAGAMDWCANPLAADAPRNVENTSACVSVGVPLYMDRMMDFRDAPQTCEAAAKHLTEDGTAGGIPPQVGDGYWVEDWKMLKPSIRCHIVKIDGKIITMR
jgi:hypothetical protein